MCLGEEDEATKLSSFQTYSCYSTRSVLRSFHELLSIDTVHGHRLNYKRFTHTHTQKEKRTKEEGRQAGKGTK